MKRHDLPRFWLIQYALWCTSGRATNFLKAPVRAGEMEPRDCHVPSYASSFVDRYFKRPRLRGAECARLGSNSTSRLEAKMSSRFETYTALLPAAVPMAHKPIACSFFWGGREPEIMDPAAPSTDNHHRAREARMHRGEAVGVQNRPVSPR